MPTLRTLAGAVAAILVMAGSAMGLEVRAAVLRIDRDLPLPISRLDIPTKDLGFAGAVMATEDNQTTGTFLGIEFTTETRAVTPEDAAAAIEALRAEGIGIIVILADGAEVTELADLAGQNVFVLNAGSRDEAVREEQCRPNLLHVAPSRAMLADAIVQFLIWKQWRRLVLVHGSHPADVALAESYRQAARKFGAEIVAEREYVDRGGARRTDTGHVMVQRDMPVFMQDLPAHDVVIAADEADVFAAYLTYHQWLPHPVAGSAGLIPVTWHPAHEAWGATQFQNRFEKLTGRGMREEDYQVWLALRVVGEAVLRTNSADPVVLRDYALSAAFELAAFKGQKLTFRPWNGQLRQPILLTDRHITVAVSPQDGFLHQVSPLDTLGADQPETRCTAFGG